MSEIIRTADKKGRVAIPGFANATVIIEQIDENEVWIRRAKVIAEKDLHFHEEGLPLKLSEEDACAFLEALENPPQPNEAARKAARKFLDDRRDH